MALHVDERVNRIVVAWSGALDSAALPELEGVLLPLLKAGAPVVLDVAGATGDAAEAAAAIDQLYSRVLAGQSLKTPPHMRLANVAPALAEALARVAPAHTAWWLAATPGQAPSTYEGLLPAIRDGFPAPTSDPERDARFVDVVSQGLERLDALKTQRPYLGERTALDYTAARAAAVPERMTPPDEAIAQVATYLEGLYVWGHPRTQENVIPPTTIPSIVGQMMAAIYNPNVIWDEYSQRVAQAEIEVSAMCARLAGYDPERAAGVFTFGGTGTTFYGVKLGLEKAQPGAFRDGVRERMYVVASDASHYAKLSVTGWLGLGTDSLVAVPTDLDNAMEIPALEAALRQRLDAGEKVAAIVATMGTTDAFGVDDLEAIVLLRDRLVHEYDLPYQPHVHADAVIGWAWSVFNEYDFQANTLGFAPRTLRSLWDTRRNVQALHLADSIGLDFHKTGYCPYVCSLVLVKDKDDLNRIARDPAKMPYLFQFGNYHPGFYTLEASRGGGGVLAALANLRFLGLEGYRVLLGHIVAMAETLRRRIEEAPHAVLLNDYNHGPVTLFRVYPDGVDASAAYRAETTDPALAAQLEAHNAYNRRVFAELHRQMEAGDGLALSLTDEYRATPYGAPILALKSYVMSPFVDEATMDTLVACLAQARIQAAVSA